MESSWQLHNHKVVKLKKAVLSPRLNTILFQGVDSDILFIVEHSRWLYNGSVLSLEGWGSIHEMS